MDKKSHSIWGIILVSACAFIWGFAFVAQRSASSAVPVLTFNGFRFSLAVVVIGIMILVGMLVDKKRGSKRIGWNKSTFIGGALCGLCLFIANNLQQYGVANTTLGKSGFLTALYIVMVPLLSVIIRKRVPTNGWIAVAIGIIGFYLTCMGEGESFTFSDADLALLVCAVWFSLQIMFIDVYVQEVDPFKITFVQFLTASLISLPAMAIDGFPPISVVSDNIWAILYVGIFSAGFGFTLQTAGQRYAPPELATLIMSLESVIAMIGGVVIFNEEYSLLEFVGCVLVLIAVFVAQIYIPKTMLTPKRSKYFVD